MSCAIAVCETTTDEKQRNYLLNLLANGRQKQKDAGDPAHLY